MLFVAHMARLSAAVVRYGVTGRRIGVVLVIVLGAIAVTAALATSAAVPMVVYPFV